MFSPVSRQVPLETCSWGNKLEVWNLKYFNMVVEVLEIFLAITKAFEIVWHDGLIFKLPQNGICGEMINFLEDFRRFRGLLESNGECSSQTNISAGKPQDLHQQLIKWDLNQTQIFCWWKVSVFCCSWHCYLSKWKFSAWVF